MKTKQPDRWRMVGIPLLTMIVVALLIRQAGGASHVYSAVRDLRWALLIPPVIISLTNLLLSAWRWQLVLSAMGHDLPYRRALAAVVAAWPVATLTPSRAGDALRAVYVRDRVPLVPGIASTVAEKLVDVQTLCLLSLIGSLAYGLWGLCGVALGVWACGWVAVVLAAPLSQWLATKAPGKRLTATLGRLLSAIHGLRQRPGRVAVVMLTSLAAWINSLLIIRLLLQATGAPVRLVHLAAVWPLAAFVGAIPVTLAGMGTRDAAFVYLLQLTSAAAPPIKKVLLASLLYALLTAWLFALLGTPVMLRLGLRRTQSEDQSTETPVSASVPPQPD